MSLPGTVRALGLGDIRVDSALNEPLSAQIDIVGATRDELAILTAQVANREVFQHYGADRPTFLASATFKVGLDSRGRPVLNVRSAEPFTDPVVNFLVDLRWNNGELIREYSLLLDPAGFGPTRLAANAAMSDRASQDSERAVAPIAAASAPASSGPVARSSVEAPRATRGSRPGAQSPGTSQEPVGAQHRVASGDTLRGIVRRAGVGNEAEAQRMMIAIFRANPHAFEANINLMHLGAVLAMPSAEDIAAIDVAQARREVRSQMTAWRLDGRPAAARRLAATGPATLAPAASAAGPAVNPPVAAHPATAASPQTAAVETPAAQALQQRVQSLEQALDDMHRQLATENATLQGLKEIASHTETAAAGTAASAAPSVVAAAPVAATPATAPAVASAPPANAVPPQGVHVEVMHAPEARPAPVLAAVGSPGGSGLGSLGMIGTAAGVLALLVGGFAYSRRRVLKSLEQPRVPPTALEPLDDAVAEAPPVAVHKTVTVEAPAAVKTSPPAVTAPKAQAPAPSPAAPAPMAEPRISIEDTTKDLAIDTEALERSYLDALAIDTLGIDTGTNKIAAQPTADEIGSHDHDTAGLDTVAIDASELEGVVDQANIHTAIIDRKAMSATAAGGTALDYNLLDLDATAEHVSAQHVQMPSALNDHVVVSERRMNIVDVLRSAIERDPNRRDLRMKLLETYHAAAATNRRGFLEVVKRLSRERDRVTADDWKKITMMGREIAADDILFADDAEDDFAKTA